MQSALPRNGTDYLKFLICARRKRQDTQERYFYEWGNIHVALMLTTPAPMRVFKRYVQHFSVAGVTDDMLIYPLSHMQWDNMADHWLATYEDFLEALTAESYVQRMQPHQFGDKEFVLQLARGEPLFQRPGFKSGGVKLIHWFKKHPRVAVEEFRRRWAKEYAPEFLEAATSRGLIRKYVQNTEDRLPPGVFKGTLFERGGYGGYAGMEEIWLDGMAGLTRLREDRGLVDLVRTRMGPLIEESGTFSMVTTERLVFDFATPNEMSPAPAILNPDSLEALIDAQGYRGWNIPNA
jgi:hypothetical protein